MSAAAEFEYIVVGSGAGGGTVAARLAESGSRVLLLEAGGDPCSGEGDAASSDEPDDSLPHQYQVPAFHAMAAENPSLKWDFFVRHYADEAQQRRDRKFVPASNGPPGNGILYPRAAALGGCTTHNAMIISCPNNSDWDYIASLTGDPSWNAQAMRTWFERLENCRHRPLHRLLAKLGINPTRHGWSGWLPTEKAIPLEALANQSLHDMLRDCMLAAIGGARNWRQRLRWILESGGDPNDWRLVNASAEGLRYGPLSTFGHQRFGTRERLLDVARRHPKNLHIELNALAARVVFDGSMRATGVEFLKGRRLYRAHADPDSHPGERRFACATREVILAGGAFNTPQILMLSGIGPRQALEAHGIECRVDLPGVGQNLQDRYEIGVVNRMHFPAWGLLRDAKFDNTDAQFREWSRTPRRGVYTTNGTVLSYIRRSSARRDPPDLFCFGLMGKFNGYFPGYSRLFPQHPNYFTWAVLKAHTNNRSGEVSLRSSDPRDVPAINFRYFNEGSAGSDEDLDAVVEGIRFVRSLTAGMKKRGLISTEEEPGVAIDSPEALRAYVRDNAWGHHASGSCAIGPREQGGVLDSAFRVHGSSGLRVVDASVFPRIPGYFIVCAVYMIAEKAAAAILDQRSAEPGVR